MSRTTYSFEEAKQAYNQGRYKEAFVILSELIIKNSRETEYILLLGKIYLKNNQLFHAKKSFKEVVSRASELNLKQEAKQLLMKIDKNKLDIERSKHDNSNIESNRPATNPLLVGSRVQPPKSTSVTIDKVAQYGSNNSKSPSGLNTIFPIKKIDKYSFKKLNLKTKITFVLIVLGVSPILIGTSIIYSFASNFIFTQIQAEKQAKVLAITDKVNRFLLERYSNVQTLASIPAFKDTQIGNFYTLSQKQLLLNNFLDTYSFYDSAAIFDTKGKLLVQSSGKKLDNYNDRSFFQEVLKTNNPVISGPEISRSSGDLVLHFAAPIKNRYKDRTVGVVISRVPVRYIEDLIREFGTLGDQYYLVNQENKIFISQLRQYLRQDADTNFPDFNEFKKVNQVGFKIGLHQQITNTPHTLIAYAPFSKLEGLPQQKWSAIVSTPTEFAFAPQQQLLLYIIIIIGLIALLVSILAVILSNRGTTPILNAVSAIQQLGQGNSEVKVTVEGEDEIAVLGNNINLISSKIQLMLSQIKKEHLEVEKLRNHALATAERHRKQKELIQSQLLEFQEIVRRAAAGDLTVRAKVRNSEIGTVGDFLNLIIESWQELVIQLKEATYHINISSVKNKAAIRSLDNDVNQQATETTNVLEEFKNISCLIQKIVSSASQASVAVLTTTEVVESNREVIKYPVESIFVKQATIAETSEKVKRLSESSQQIFNTVIIITELALQAKLLAVNAGIKAAHIGKDEQEFSIVVDEITPLATKWANATYALEELIKNIQIEVNQVVETMKVQQSQLLEETQLTINAKKGVQQIETQIFQINKVIDFILKSPLSQTEIFQAYTQSIQHLLQSSKRTAASSEEVSHLTQETAHLIQSLHTIINNFKVD